MKSNLILVIAVALLVAAPGIAAAADTSHAKGAASVAEMLQHKRDQKLRAQLVDEGRWIEAQQLDEDIARDAQKAQERRLRQVNEQLARGARIDGPANETVLNQCDPEKLRADKLKTEASAPARTAVR